MDFINQLKERMGNCYGRGVNRYGLSELTRLVTKYNECAGFEVKIFKEKKRPDQKPSIGVLSGLGYVARKDFQDPTFFTFLKDKQIASNLNNARLSSFTPLFGIYLDLPVPRTKSSLIIESSYFKREYNDQTRSTTSLFDVVSSFDYRERVVKTALLYTINTPLKNLRMGFGIASNSLINREWKSEHIIRRSIVEDEVRTSFVTEKQEIEGGIQVSATYKVQKWGINLNYFASGLTKSGTKLREANFSIRRRIFLF